MPDFVHQRQKPPTPLERPRELVVVCAPLRSNVNLSRIVRAAGCCGVRRLIACGTPKVIEKIARDSMADDDPADGATRHSHGDKLTAGAERSADAPSAIRVEVHRTLPPVLKELKRSGLQLVGLEQATGSQSLFEFRFPRNTALVVGNERLGLDDESLRLVDYVVEIPVYGRPLAHNVATATAMALYEYCRQWPKG